jgi:hypothetical protein
VTVVPTSCGLVRFADSDAYVGGNDGVGDDGVGDDGGGVDVPALTRNSASADVCGTSAVTPLLRAQTPIAYGPDAFGVQNSVVLVLQSWSNIHAPPFSLTHHLYE